MFPRKSDKDTDNRQVLTPVGNKKIGYERRDQKIILKCDTFQKKQKKMQRESHSTRERRPE